MLPSDPGYIPACTDERVLASPYYKELLRLNTDPYALHSRDESMIRDLEGGGNNGRETR
jgi:hypothetical protein